VVRGKVRYTPCTNLARGEEHFVIDPIAYAEAEDLGEIIAIVHSHPDAPPAPSQPDLVGCERSGLPWIIVGWPTGKIETVTPTGYEAPYVGRQWAHGVLDCYTLIQDYYGRELGIRLPDFDRRDEWWLHGQDLYREHQKAVGFVRVDQPKVHDVILMQIAAPVPNHAAILVDDNVILHHMANRVSSRDVYGGWYHRVTEGFYRHRTLLG